MQLSEIRALRATCRAKLEDLIGRTSSREMSTEENQMFADLKAEGERLASLESRYAVLESFDKPTTTTTIVRQPIVTTEVARKDDEQGGEIWSDSKGNPVAVLAKNQSYARAVRSDAKKPNFGFGDFVKALVLPNGNSDIRAALSESGGISTGDVTVPTVLMPELIDLMRNKTVCIQAGALTVPLETENTDIARLSADPVPSWRSEAAAVAVADPTFERVRFNPKSLAVVVKISMELLEDAKNINQAILRAFAGAFAVELDRVGLFGSGTAPQPHGISGTTNVGSVDMGVNGAALTNYDPFADAISALLTANAAMPTAAIMAPRTLTKIAKLKDTQTNPMRVPDLVAKVPFLATTSVPINQTHGTSNVASEVVVGDFTQLMFGIRTQLRIQVLRERFLADNGQIGFLADLRADVQLRHPQSFCEVLGVL